VRSPQQVDEARHAVLFARFMREVAGTGADTASALSATSPQLTWGFRKVFGRLDRMADELRRDRSRPTGKLRMLARAPKLFG
jgi:hypothetical protein